jgi:hypothetical protein
LFAVVLLTPGASPGMAQAVPRTDSLRAGVLRVTVEPRVETWSSQYLNGRRSPLGAPFSGDSANVWFPSVTRLERDIRTVTGLTAFTATLGHDPLAIRAERRTTAIGLDFGITSKLAVSVMMPLVRVNVQETYRLGPAGANLGAILAGDSVRYRTFFTHLDGALTALGDSIAAGAYGCPAGPACARAQALQAQGQELRDALYRAVFGTVDTVAQYLPIRLSDAGQSIATIVSGIGRALADTFGIAQFSRDTFLLPLTPASSAGLDSVLRERTTALGLSPFGANTDRRYRYFAGDAEVSVRYRVVGTRHWAAAAALLVRLPTGHQDSPNDAFDLATGDHQTDVELRLVQEITLAHRFWLNLAVRAGQQRPGTRERRVAPWDSWLVSRNALSRLDWDPGDYLAVDFAPLLRLGNHLGAGLTLGYFTKGRDRYSFATAADSVALATQFGAPLAASILDAGTSERRTRIGAAVTYTGPNVEGGLSFEQTVSGYGGLIPVASVYRIVMRTSRWPF